MKPFISVVMPVHNEVRYIQATLEKLISQEYPSDCFEILVVDGMSGDGTREIVIKMGQLYPQIRLLDNAKRFSSAGRNIGFISGKGDIFTVVDGHCYIPDNQLLNNLVECFEKSGADCLGRPQPLDPPGLTLFQKSVALARRSRLGHGSDSLIYSDYEGFASPVSNGAAYTRRLFEKVGYVDEQFDAAEDVEFNFRVEQAGMTCYTSPKLTVRYYPRENLVLLFKQMVRYGKGRSKFAKKHPQAMSINQLIPAAFLVGIFILLLSFVLLIITGMVTPLFISALPFMLYFILVGFESIRIAFKDGISYALPAPAIFFAIHVGLGWGYLSSVVMKPSS